MIQQVSSHNKGTGFTADIFHWANVHVFLESSESMNSVSQVYIMQIIKDYIVNSTQVNVNCTCDILLFQSFPFYMVDSKI